MLELPARPEPPQPGLTNFSRRSFLKRGALIAGAVSLSRFFPAVDLLAAPPGRRLNCVLIGCGGRGMSHLDWVVSQSKDNLVAIVDPDEKRIAVVKKWLEGKKVEAANLAVFHDYRTMFERIGKGIDAVFIATPNHQHALPAMMAMQLGKGVFCEKPLCHTVAEARRLRAAAQKSKAPTQMGNQGHNEEGYRRLCEFIWGGVVGHIRETHSWTDRANGGSGPRPPYLPVPEGLHWDEWIGPAPFRKFHSDLHPHEWHGWYDFGNGSIGNMGCHVLDGVFWSLKVEHPESFEMEEVRDGTSERYPSGCRIRFDIPARGDLPPLKAYWYEGLKKDGPAALEGKRSARGKGRNLPPILEELKKRYPDEEFESNGTVYIGDQGVLYTGTYGGRMHVLPFEKMQQMKQPARSLPRPSNVMMDFIGACREGLQQTAAAFDYGARLTEFTLLGNLAQRAGVGQKVEWDGQAARVRNLRELNAWIDLSARPGWTA